MINQVNVGADNIGSNTRQTIETSRETKIDDPPISKGDSASTEVKPSVIVELGNGKKAEPITYSFASGPGKPASTQSITSSDETVKNIAATEINEFGGGGVKRPPP